MTSLLNNKGLSKSEMAVAVEMEIRHELEEVRKAIDSEKTNNGVSGLSSRLYMLRGKENGLKHVLEFMSKNLKKGVK